MLTVVILAGGQGTRLGNLTKNTVKALVEVNNQPIIAYAIDFAKKLGAGKIIISGNHRIELLERAIKQIDSSIAIIKDEQNKPGCRIIGLCSTEQYVEGDVIYFDGDYIYHPKVADLIKNINYKDVSVHASDTRSQYTEQDVIVRFDNKKNMLDIFKTKGTKPLGAGEYYFNSLLYIPENKTKDFFSTARDVMNNNYPHLEDAVLEYKKQGRVVKTINLGEPLWIEIDNSQELAAAKNFVNKYNNYFNI